MSLASHHPDPNGRLCRVCLFHSGVHRSCRDMRVSHIHPDPGKFGMCNAKHLTFVTGIHAFTELYGGNTPEARTPFYKHRCSVFSWPSSFSKNLNLSALGEEGGLCSRQSSYFPSLHLGMSLYQIPSGFLQAKSAAIMQRKDRRSPPSPLRTLFGTCVPIPGFLGQVQFSSSP